MNTSVHKFAAENVARCFKIVGVKFSATLYVCLVLVVALVKAVLCGQIKTGIVSVVEI